MVQQLGRSGTPRTPGTPENDGWARCFARLEPALAPAGFSDCEWRELLQDGNRFFEQWGPQAAELGWTALDLFGVHPVAPAARYDCMGLVPIIRGHVVVALDNVKASLQGRSGASLTYLRRPLSGAVLLWDYPASTAHMRRAP